MLGWIMGRGEPRGGKEREIRRQSVPSLQGGMGILIIIIIIIIVIIIIIIMIIIIIIIIII